MHFLAHPDTPIRYLGVKWSQVQILSARHRSEAVSEVREPPFFMPYRLCIPPSQSERIAKPVDCGPRRVVAGVSIHVAGDADRRVAE